MLDMRNTKTKRTIAAGVAIVLIIAMVATMIIGAFM